jgi:hypothetical protein
MNTIQFLAEWAVRSSILILSGALLLRVLRVKDSSIRLAAWTAMLCGSLAIPAMTSRCLACRCALCDQRLFRFPRRSCLSPLLHRCQPRKSGCMMSSPRRSRGHAPP